jgi:myo-inositol-1(or 4)-monophosphatase
MLERIIEISKQAGEVIRSGYRKDFGIEFKTNKSDLVTEIDKRSEKLIMDFIKKEFPTHGILSEESGSFSNNAEYIWVIDPLDGTTNFAHGLPIFSVSIGVVKNGETIAGVVYDVMRDIIYSAEKGSGAFEQGNKIHVSSNGDLEQSLLVTGFPYDIKNNPSHVIERFNAFLFEARAVRRLGSAALDFCYVASGIFDGFWEVVLNPWDIAAGKLIVEEAGGKVTNFYGKGIDIFSKQILATNGIVHEKMERILQRFQD